MTDSQINDATPARKWQPFETAPKVDGNAIAVLLDDGTESVAIWSELPKKWDPDGHWSGWMVDVKARTDLDYEITHWRPLEGEAQ